MTAKKGKKNGRMLVPAKLTESARSVWLAGVGALAVAEDRSGKLVTDSEKLFGRLVKEGRTYETKNRKRLADMLDTMKEGVKGAREDVGAAVGKVKGRLEAERAIEAAGGERQGGGVALEKGQIACAAIEGVRRFDVARQEVDSLHR